MSVNTNNEVVHVVQVVQLSIPALHNIQIRERSTKHWSPEFKKLRRMKVTLHNLLELQDVKLTCTKPIAGHESRSARF